MRRSTVFCLLLLSGLLVGEQICYICSGDSPLKGSFCNNDKVCTGTSCEITLRLSGAWFANCSSEAVDSKNPCVIDLVNTKASCKCGQSMCNSPQAIVKSIQDFLPPIFKNFTPEMPNLPIPCFECGDVVSSSKNLYTNCDEASICWGSFCYTKRGDNPHSYCGSSWDGNKDEGCFKTPAEDEVCVCKTPMCNVPYTKRTVIPKLISGSTVRQGRVPVMSTMKPEMMTSLGSVRPMTTTTAMGAIGTMRLASASGLVTTMKPGTTPLRPGSTTMKPGGAPTPKRSTTTESIYEYYDYEYTDAFPAKITSGKPLSLGTTTTRPMTTTTALGAGGTSRRPTVTPSRMPGDAATSPKPGTGAANLPGTTRPMTTTTANPAMGGTTLKLRTTLKPANCTKTVSMGQKLRDIVLGLFGRMNSSDSSSSGAC